MVINWEYYKTFYYVAKCRSVSQAARELSVSQPAVSQVLKQLEGNLETVLFCREARGVRLTAEGQLLFEYVQKGYEQIELGEQKLRQLRVLEAGEITIGASDMTLRFYLLPYLEKFHELYPKIKVTVTNAPTPETLKELRNGRIDFGIVSSPVSETADMEIIPVREIEDIFVAGMQYARLKDRPVLLKELEGLSMIFLEGNTSTRRYMDEFLTMNGVEVYPEFELATSDMIVQFARRNLGVGCVMRDFAEEYLKKGELFELQLQQRIPGRQLCVARNTRQPLSAAAKRMLELMER